MLRINNLKNICFSYSEQKTTPYLIINILCNSGQSVVYYVHCTRSHGIVLYIQHTWSPSHSTVLYILCKRSHSSLCILCTRWHSTVLYVLFTRWHSTRSLLRVSRPRAGEGTTGSSKGSEDSPNLSSGGRPRPQRSWFSGLSALSASGSTRWVWTFLKHNSTESGFIIILYKLSFYFFVEKDYRINGTL